MTRIRGATIISIRDNVCFQYDFSAQLLFQSLYSKIVSAQGINLSVLQGAYQGKNGTLISPDRLLVVTSYRHLLDLEGATLEVGACSLDGFEQINLRKAQLQVAGPLHVASQSQWIEAQQAIFVHVGEPAFFEAKESIYFDHNTGTLNALRVVCNAFNFDNGTFSVQEDVAIQVNRFIGNNNALSVGSKVLLQATTSISSNACEIKVIHGSIVQESENWVIMSILGIYVERDLTPKRPMVV